MKKNTEFWMVIAVFILLLSSCDKQKKELKEEVEKFNNQCPISLGDVGAINSVSYDGEIVEMKFSSNETFAPISSLSNHQQEFKEAISIGLTRGANKKFVDMIIAAKSTLRILFIGSQTGQRAETSMTFDELSKTMDKFSNMNDKQKLILSMLIGSKIKLPIMIDNITKLVGLSLTSDALIYKYEISDPETGQNMDSSISFIKYITLSQMAHSINNGMMGERNRQFYQALMDCNQGLEYEYHELNTGKRVSFRISTDEIKDVLSGKYQDSPTASDWEDLSNTLEELSDSYEEDVVADTVW